MRAIKSYPGQYSDKSLSFKEENGDSSRREKKQAEKDAEKIKFLENKIEYLNNLVTQMKKQGEGKSASQRGKEVEKDKTEEKIQFLNQTINQLKEQNKALEAEKTQSEADMRDLLTEFSLMKQKYEADLEQMAAKINNMGVPANKKVVDASYIEGLEAEVRKLSEQQEFSEQLEEIEKYREAIAERDKKISSLRLQLEEHQVTFY